MKQIVIGTDGSEAATAAVRWGAQLAARTGAKVVVASSVEPLVRSLPAREWADRSARLAEELDGWCEPLRQAGVAFEAVVLDLSPWFGLADRADEDDADLIVVGSRGAGGFQGLLLGSVADHLAHVVDRPLAVVPPDWEAGRAGGVVLGIDGSEGAASAAAWTGALAKELDVAVTAVHVSHRLFGRPAAAPVELEGEWTQPLRDLGLEPVCRAIDDGHPTEALLAAAEEVGAELVVVGTRATSSPIHARLGGVTMQLLHHRGRLPVVIVPPTG